MRNICFGIALASLFLLTTDQAEAGRRRCRVRQRCVPCAQNSACCSSCTATTNGAIHPSPDPFLAYFPDVCPTFPQFPDGNGNWVWDAERHYGEGKNCSNCFIEPAMLIGDYDLYGDWPYACGDSHCEPSTNIRSRAVEFSGTRLNAEQNPVTLNFDPITDMPPRVDAREITPRRYISITDRASNPRTRFFIVYSIRVSRRGRTVDAHFGHEVPESELSPVRDQIRYVDPVQVSPLDKFGLPQAEHSYVYVVRDQDDRNAFVLYLKRD